MITKSCTLLIQVVVLLLRITFYSIVICYWLRLKQLVSGMPSSPPHETLAGSGPNPSESADGILPITASVIGKNEKMNPRTIIIIALSSILLLLVLVGALSIIFKWRKIQRLSSAVGPAFTSSLNKRSGIVLNLILCMRVL